jgi:Flp pilus assembly protein TadD
MTKAINVLKKALELDAKLRKAHLNPAFAYRSAGHTDETLLAYKRMTEALPQDAEGFSILANANTAAGQFEKALEAYKSYAQLKPNDVATQNMLGARIPKPDSSRKQSVFLKK